MSEQEGGGGQALRRQSSLGVAVGSAAPSAASIVVQRQMSRYVPATMSEYDHRSNQAWFVSFVAMMTPFTAFCFANSRNWTARVVERVATSSKYGVYGLLALPFCTIAMEKCIYDTVQSVQGFDPTIRPKDRGGFPSGGADMFPSFSLVPVQQTEWNKLGLQQQHQSREASN